MIEIQNMKQSAWKIGYYASTIVLVVCVIAGIAVFSEDVLLEIVELSAQFGMVMLAVMFAIKNIGLAHKRGENQIADVCRKQLPWQREQGLIAFNAFALHIASAAIVYLLRFKVALGVMMYMSFSAIIPTLVMLYLYATSFKPVQKRVKNWKKSHSIGWVLFGTVIGHELVLTNHLSPIMMGSTLLAVGTLIYGFIVQKGNKRSKKQLYITGIGMLLIGVIFLASNTIGKEIQKIGIQTHTTQIYTKR